MPLRLSEANAARLQKGHAPTRHKYGAQRVQVDGITFASKREAERYCDLKLLEKAGEIRGLHLQPWFSLLAPRLMQDAVGCAEVGRYVGDFGYHDKEGRYVVEDVKSPPTRTKIYRWKVKHLKLQYGIEIREI